MFTFAPASDFAFPSERGRASASDPDVARYIENTGLEFGRHGPERCPWCGQRAGDCNPCVVVNEDGIRCHRCGVSRPWAALLDCRPVAGELYAAARNFVHFEHQKLVLGDGRPSTPQALLRPTWNFMLRRANADRLERDPTGASARIEKATSSDLDVVRSVDGAWLSATGLVPRKVAAERTLRSMPWANSPARVDKALSNEPLEGFVAIDPLPNSLVLAPNLPETSGIRIRRPPLNGEAPAVTLGACAPDQETLERAWRFLEGELPGLHRGYLEALILVGLVAQHALATPPMIVVTGLSGVAKTATAHLAAAMLGTRLGDITLNESSDVMRQIALHLEAGASPIFVDEVGRTRHIYEKLEPILKLNGRFTFRAKYRNEQTISARAPIVLAGSTLPKSIVTSQELCRRAVGYHLQSKALHWQRNGDVAYLRRLPTFRSHLDTITGGVWWKLEASGASFDWRTYCLNDLGAVEIHDLDIDGNTVEGRDNAVRELYEAYRRSPESQLTSGNKWRGWLDCAPVTPNGNILGDLIDFDADHRASFAELEELKRLDLTAILGFESPRLQLSVQHRGSQWLVKFIEVGVVKGRGRGRGDFPPVGLAMPAVNGQSNRLAQTPCATSVSELPSRDDQETVL